MPLVEQLEYFSQAGESRYNLTCEENYHCVKSSLEGFGAVQALQCSTHYFILAAGLFQRALAHIRVQRPAQISLGSPGSKR